MKKTTLLAIICLAFSSCSTSYYYAQMKSNDPYMEKDEMGNFIIDSDSLCITYSFYGKDAPVKISVKNKSEKNIYVDWGESFFIFGDDDDNRLNLGDYMEEWELVQPVESRKEISRHLFELSNLNFEKTDPKLYKEKTIRKADGKTIKLESVDYTEENTPLYMQSSIVLYIGRIYENPLSFNQDFHISSVAKARNLDPNKLAAYANRNGDSFYVKIDNGKGFRKFLETAGQVLIITGGIAEIIMSSRDTEYEE